MEIEKDEIEQAELEYRLDQEKLQSFGTSKAAEINESERTVTAIISTGSIDRDGEVLNPGGMDKSNFDKNPVVPWSHDSGSPPIGKALWTKASPSRNPTKILAKVKFATTERAEEIWQLFKGGFLNAFSVGFKPLEGHRPTPDDIKKNPNLANARFIFDKWELLEFSPVTVPANAEALALAVKSKSITLSDDMIEVLHVKAIEEPEPEILVSASDFREKAIEVSIPVEEIIEVDIL
jgi:HK97 family phage prohead protease